MNGALKSAIFNPQSRFFNLQAALFHSTPVLERKRRNHWHTPRSHHISDFRSKRFRRTQSKQSVFYNISAFVDHIIQCVESCQENINDDDPSSSRGTSWFEKDSGRSKQTQYQGRQGRGRRGACIYEEIDEEKGFVEVERVFESIFGRRQHSRWRSRDKQNSRSRVEEDYEFEEESESPELDMASHRQALGLNASGPLKLEDVKIAYRACALKWHPDRHQGSSKAVAEEKFKFCSAAYQSLCHKLAVD